MNKRRLPRSVVSTAELAPYLPPPPARPLTGSAYRVNAYVVQWLATAPQAAVLPFRTLEAALKLPSAVGYRRAK